VDRIRTFKPKTKFAMSSGLALALALAIWSPLQAQIAEPQQAKSMMAAMMEKCQEMKARKQRMKEDTAAQEAQLTEQLSEMNRAPEDKKIGLMAAVVTHMAEQQISMHARKAKMEDEMMQHMMRHMQMGKESMAQCPMMKDMSSPGPQKGHHPEPK
jgi:5,10-methylene-tetrahydrofolate dehydrogenase/methenyl tetrahydrofolate cyclohydrolase